MMMVDLTVVRSNQSCFGRFGDVHALIDPFRNHLHNNGSISLCDEHPSREHPSTQDVLDPEGMIVVWVVASGRITASATLEPDGMIVVRVLASIRIKASVMNNNRHTTIKRWM